MVITSLCISRHLLTRPSHLFRCPDYTYVSVRAWYASPYGAITSSVTKTSHIWLSLLTASHHSAVLSHGISSFDWHISRYPIIWLSYLTASHHLAVISHGISSFGCHISRHLIIWLSYLTAYHHLAVISHGISSFGCHISRHLRFHDISWGKVCCSNSSLLECSPSTAQARVRSRTGQSRDL